MGKQRLITLGLLLSLSCIAVEDFGQGMMGDAPEMDLSEIKDTKNSGFFTDNSDSPYENIKSSKPSVYVPGQQEKNKLEASSRGYSSDSKVQIMGAGEEASSYIEISNEEILSKTRSKGTHAINISYISDDYTFKSSNNSYESTYNSTTGKRYGALHVGGEYYLSKGFINTGWGLQAGLGLTQGKGVFVSGVTSETDFSLWYLPVDLLFNLEIPANYVNFQFSVGPSIMGLIQNRNDREETHPDEVKRQIGKGFAAVGKVKFNIGKFSTNKGFLMYQQYNISNMFFNLEVRVHDYSGFKQEDLSVDGMSIGAGFTFEYF